MLDHPLELTTLDGCAEVDGVPVPLVHVIPGTHGGMTGAKLQRRFRIAFEIHRARAVIEPDEREHALAHLENHNAFTERVVLDGAGHTGAQFEHFISGHGKDSYAKGDIVPIQELAAFVGRWELAVDLPGAQDVRGDVTFESMGELLIERAVIPVPEAPDSCSIIMDHAGGLTQHYFDSRGVARQYEMTFDGHTWTLERTKPDLSPLEFCQRYIGTFSADGNVIDGEWQTSADGTDWARDFRLTYRRLA
jgi:hypothetical protein